MMGRHHVLIGAIAMSVLTGCVPSGGTQDGASGSVSSGESEVFAQMSDVDVSLANSALDTALESRVSGAAVSWRNPETGSHGSITPLKSFRNGNGTFCRRYSEELVIGGRRARFEDLACRQGRRYWVPVGS